MTSELSGSGKKGAARAYLQTAAQLRTMIGQLGIDVNGRLPAERELAQLLGVSRPTLREALIVLELQGEIEIRVGSGIYIRPPAPDAATRPSADAATPVPSREHDAEGRHAVDLSLNFAPEDSPRDVNQMRYFLESAIAAEAARFMPATLRKKLKKSLDDMQQAQRANSPGALRSMTDADRLFHMTLAQSTDNQLVIQTIAGLFDHRYQPIASKMHMHFDDHRSWESAIDEHRQIYAAIENRDPLQAQAAMQRHLSQAHQRLMKLIG